MAAKPESSGRQATQVAGPGSLRSQLRELGVCQGILAFCGVQDFDVWASLLGASEAAVSGRLKTPNQHETGEKPKSAHTRSGNVECSAAVEPCTCMSIHATSLLHGRPVRGCNRMLGAEVLRSRPRLGFKAFGVSGCGRGDFNRYTQYATNNPWTMPTYGLLKRCKEVCESILRPAPHGH